MNHRAKVRCPESCPELPTSKPPGSSNGIARLDRNHQSQVAEVVQRRSFSTRSISRKGKAPDNGVSLASRSSVICGRLISSSHAWVLDISRCANRLSARCRDGDPEVVAKRYSFRQTDSLEVRHNAHVAQQTQAAIGGWPRSRGVGGSPNGSHHLQRKVKRRARFRSKTRHVSDDIWMPESDHQVSWFVAVFNAS